MKYILICLSLLVFNCRPDKKYHDEEKDSQNIVMSDALKDIIDFQKKLNEEFKNPETSPLPDRYRKDFESLDFFEPDTNFRVMAKFERTPDAIPFMMPTTTERKSREVVYGIASFSFKGKEYKLEIYQSPELIKDDEYEDYLFLPFLDKSNGEETYAGGRYLDLTVPKGDSVLIDFNKAYNPYCVYNKKYSCPIVPSVNMLDVKVLAGVKAFKK